MKSPITINTHRDGSVNRDRALLDLLELEQLGVAPGVAPVALLKALWNLSQSQVSRRINAIAELGIYQVRPGHGRYTLIQPRPTRPEPKPQQLSPRERWEAARKQLQEVVG
jgi:hypothetical protein